MISLERPGETEMDSFDVQTRQRNTLLDITAQVRDSLRRSGLVHDERFAALLDGQF